MNVELIKNVDYEIKETLEDLILKMKKEILEILCVVKFLVKKDEFEFVHKFF